MAAQCLIWSREHGRWWGPGAERLGEGPLTERTAGVQPAWRELVFMPLSCHSLNSQDAGANDRKRTFGFGPLLATETGHSNGSSKPTPATRL
jgi:hypothetical protein